MDNTTMVADSMPKLHSRRRLYLAGAALLGVLALNAGVTQLLIALQRPVTVSFDMKGTIDQFMTQTAAHQLTQSQSDVLTLRFTTALDASLKGYQHRHDALILVTPSVVAGAKDITADIQRDVARQMRAEQEEAQ